MGMVERGERVEACGGRYSTYVCKECGVVDAIPEFRCGDRLCSLCARHRSERLLAKYGEALREANNPKMVTLSMRSRGLGELEQAVDDLWEAFGKLRRRRVWKAVEGAIVSLEITFNPKRRTWHPHLHILASGDYIVWERLLLEWKDVTGGEGSSVYIQKCVSRWEYELVKYITKVNDLLQCPEAIREFLGFCVGKRFVRTYGTFYNCRTDQKGESGQVICPGCGAVMEFERSGVSVYELYRRELSADRVVCVDIGRGRDKPPPEGSLCIDAKFENQLRETTYSGAGW